MAERKRPRRTRQRIVETSLALFNRQGAPHVTTAEIADEMGISPGNLYYHFRNREEIVGELFAAFERRLEDLFAAPADRLADVEDVWLFLHLLFEAMWDYRFLYRDLDEILSRSDKVSARFLRLMRRIRQTMFALCGSMVAAGTMRASEGEIAALADNASLVATYWMSYQKFAASEPGNDEVSLDRAAYQVLSLIAPFLQGPSRALLTQLSRNYLSADC
ncbi:MAG TPA: TetR/AcrR family transcriptional regulator [Casimicrobiaceae bacterium]|nr:TetR/AcrR family transcriptional regulator [Casimicrobiaceae bacterium]